MTFNPSNMSVAIIGASIGGLSAANALHQVGVTVHVYEAVKHPFHDRGAAIGIDHNLLQQLRGSSTSTPPQITGSRDFYGDIWQYLYEGLPSGTVTFGSDVTGVADAGSASPRLLLDDGSTMTQGFDLIIGADGGKSIIRPYVTPELPEYGGYTLWRGLLPMSHTSQGPRGNRVINGIEYDTGGFQARINGEPHWNVGVYMAMPEADVKAPHKNRQAADQESSMKVVPEWFVPLTKTLFGDRNGRFWQTCVDKGKVTPHPIWELSVSKAVKGRLLLLGDAAHMASPRTGAGARNAMMDAAVLGAALGEARSLREALERYDGDVVARGRQLHNLSRRIAGTYTDVRNPSSVVHPDTLVGTNQGVQ